jgi:hypothetical protein
MVNVSNTDIGRYVLIKKVFKIDFLTRISYSIFKILNVVKNIDGVRYVVYCSPVPSDDKYFVRFYNDEIEKIIDKEEVFARLL